MHAEILLALSPQSGGQAQAGASQGGCRVGITRPECVSRGQTLTYRVPETLRENIQPGVTVNVPLRGQIRTGLVIELHERAIAFAAKEILEVKKSEPLLEPWQMDLAEWMAKTYFTPLFSVLKMMLPPNVRNPHKKTPKLETRISTKATRDQKTLTQEQKDALTTLLQSPAQHFLLQGVTGSGKTEIYLRLAEETLQKGQSFILLVPEVALTPQMIDSFGKKFPGRLEVLHSYLGAGERERAWWRIKQGQASLILGSRSALFAPVKNPGWIVMDEEHEPSYKQESTPYYHARDVAFEIARQTGAKLLLGSATPSLETRYLVEEGKMVHLTLPRRIHHETKTTIQIVDLREELKKKNMSIFSEVLVEKLQKTLTEGRQAILFLNRRGHTPCVLCRSCGKAIDCPRCDVALTYHSHGAERSGHRFPSGKGRVLNESLQEQLRCHHCEWKQELPNECPQCGSTAIKFVGVGTQQVEAELQKRFPTARVVRADRDTMGRKGSFQTLYETLKNREVDILVGTQMIGKGWDLPNVTLVGVILADIGFHMPDFRATERSFQLLMQVAGRAGRAEHAGEVVLQTYNPDHMSLPYVKNEDYEGFFKEEMKHRLEMGYPPLSQIIKLSYKHTVEKTCEKEASAVAEKLKRIVAAMPTSAIVTHAPAGIPKTYNQYRYHVFIQGENPQKVLQRYLQKEPLKRGWSIDVGPLQMA